MLDVIGNVKVAGDARIAGTIHVDDFMIMDDQGEQQLLEGAGLLSVVDFAQEDFDPFVDWYLSGNKISLLNDVEYLQTINAPIQINDIDGDGSVNAIEFDIESHDDYIDENLTLTLSTYDYYLDNGGSGDLGIDAMVFNVSSSANTGDHQYMPHNLVFANNVYALQTMHASRFIGDGSQLTDLNASAFDFSGETVIDELFLKTTSNGSARHGLLFQNSSDAYVWDIYRTASTGNNAWNSSLVFAGGPNEDAEADLPHVMSLREDGLVFIGAGYTDMVNLAGDPVGDLQLSDGDYKLAVDGKAIAEEVTVLNFGDWADFVFEENYVLESIEEVKQYIKVNGHLEHIPTTAEVEAKGINLGKMDAKLLRKIEELTLYMIEMNQLVNALEQENSQLIKTLSR
jgi:hypothetical protein